VVPAQIFPQSPIVSIVHVFGKLRQMGTALAAAIALFQEHVEQAVFIQKQFRGNVKSHRAQQNLRIRALWVMVAAGRL
jgi:hypothetical protein